MTKKPWDVPDPPDNGDATNDITFQAVGRALSQWEWFEGNLSLIFSHVIGSGHGNVAASRAYGSIEVFRVRKNLIENAAELYFRINPDDALQSKLTQLLKHANEFSGRRNEIAHGIVNPYISFKDDQLIGKGWALFPAYYATRKRKLPENKPLEQITLTYTYSSVEIEKFGNDFSNLANSAIDILGDFVVHARRKRSHP